MKIISGGQTGVDRAALDVAIALGIPCGGYCPKGRLAEDGRIPDLYPLEEMPTADYPARTRANIAAAGMTLILIAQESDLRGGTMLTLRMAKASADRGGSGFRVYLMTHHESLSICRADIRFVGQSGVSVVNVAGPRESKSPGIYDMARGFLTLVLTRGE
jgi:hypothetical protein